MSLSRFATAACAAVFLSVSAQAETMSTRHGGDTFVAASSVVEGPGQTPLLGVNEQTLSKSRKTVKARA